MLRLLDRATLNLGLADRGDGDGSTDPLASAAI